LRSCDKRQALIVASLRGSDDAKIKLAATLSPAYTTNGDIVTTGVTGSVEVTRELAVQAQKDLAKAGLLTGPFTLLALVIVFGSLIARCFRSASPCALYWARSSYLQRSAKLTTGSGPVTYPATSRPSRFVNTSPAGKPTPYRYKSRASTQRRVTRQSIDSPAGS